MSADSTYGSLNPEGEKPSSKLPKKAPGPSQEQLQEPKPPLGHPPVTPVLWANHRDSDQTVSASQSQALGQKRRTAMGRTQFLIGAQRGERSSMNPPGSQDSREPTPLLTWGRAEGQTDQECRPSVRGNITNGRRQHLQAVSSHHPWMWLPGLVPQGAARRWERARAAAAELRMEWVQPETVQPCAPHASHKLPPLPRSQARTCPLRPQAWK